MLGYKISPIVVFPFGTLKEEKRMKEKFGEEYIEYCKKVNQIIPWFRKKLNVENVQKNKIKRDEVSE